MFVLWLGRCVTLRIVLGCCVPSTCVHTFLYMFAQKRLDKTTRQEKRRQQEHRQGKASLTKKWRGLRAIIAEGLELGLGLGLGG